MPQPEEGRSLHRKLAQIMFEAERIPKNGKAPAAMGGFAFVQVGDAADYIRKALAEHVITMMPSKVTVLSQLDRPTKAGGSMTTVDLMVEWTLTDGESGESMTIESFGAGADSGDKYSGKAQTNAMKYGLLMGFLLSTGEDPELGDGAERRTAPEAPERPQTRAASSPALPAHAERVVAERRPAEEPEAVQAAFAAFGEEIAQPAELGVFREGEVHLTGHKPLRLRANGSLFCPTKVGDEWCTFVQKPLAAVR